MSHFSTKIPVDLDAVKKLLPLESHIEAVRWNHDKKELELRWYNERLQSPYTYHQEFPVEMLKAKDLPASVTVRERRTPTVNTHLDTPKKPVDRKPKKNDKGT